MTEICLPCRKAADQAVLLRRLPGTPLGHKPEVCRDHKIQPGGCPCQHQAPAAPPSWCCRQIAGAVSR